MMKSPTRQTVALIESGVAALNAGDISTAARAFKKALPKSPKDPELLNLMAVTEVEQGQFRSAIKYLQKAIKISPTYADAYNTMGVAYRQSKNIVKAIEAFLLAVEYDPDGLMPRTNLMHAYNDANQSDLALPHGEILAGVRPQDDGLRYRLGMTRMALGDLETATTDFRAVVELNPSHGGAWWQLAGLDEIDIDIDREALERARNSHAGAPGEEAKIAFSMFIGYEQAGDIDKAARFLVEGNDLRNRTISYDIEDDEAKISDIARIYPTFDADRPDKMTPQGVTPVYVLGMPRSGTTLIEQILASHSSIYGAGECNSVGRAVRNRTRDGADYPQSTSNWRTNDFTWVGRKIVDHLSELSGNADFVIDKTPRNFLFLGVIKRALPHARIIHCVRDPIDTAFSNYRQLFTNGNEYSYEQANLVRFMQAYQKLMAHWRKVMPEGFLDVRYEDVIADQKGQTQRMLDFCGLPWEDACLDFHTTKRSVQTASMVQVRKKLYATSMRSWEPYSEHITTLIDGLGGD